MQIIFTSQDYFNNYVRQYIDTNTVTGKAEALTNTAFSLTLLVMLQIK